MENIRRGQRQLSSLSLRCRPCQVEWVPTYYFEITLSKFDSCWLFIETNNEISRQMKLPFQQDLFTHIDNSNLDFCLRFSDLASGISCGWAATRQCRRVCPAILAGFSWSPWHRQEEILAELDYREKDGYERVLLTVQRLNGTSFDALTWVACHDNSSWFGEAPMSRLVEQINRAEGLSGANGDYVTQLDSALHVQSIADGLTSLRAKCQPWCAR